MSDLRRYFDAPAAQDLRGAALGDVNAQSIMQYVDAAKNVANSLGPIGQIAGGLIQVGEGVYNEYGQQVGTAIGNPVVVPAPPPGRRPITITNQRAIGAGVPKAMATSSSPIVPLAAAGALAWFLA